MKIYLHTIHPTPRSHKRGFTLIELLAVVAIIAILGGIGVSGFNSFKAKAKDQEARTQLHYLENGIEGFFADRGFYPVAMLTGQETNTFGNGEYTGSRESFPRDANAIIEDTSTQCLIYCLGGQSIKDEEAEVTPIIPELGPPGSAKTSMVDIDRERVLDAYGRPYSYREAPADWQTSSKESSGSINPTFDLWSAGVDGIDDTPDDITNWR